jgi:hypothetical protein
MLLAGLAGVVQIKCHLGKQEVFMVWECVQQAGHEPRPRKSENNQGLACSSEVKSFLQTCQFFSKYIPKFPTPLLFLREK